MLPVLEEYRKANGPILVVVLMGVTSTLLGGALVWVFGRLADWWWAILAAAIALTVVVSSLRAWYWEWKRAEAESARADQVSRQSQEAWGLCTELQESLSKSELRAAASRLVAEYLSVLPLLLPSKRLATRIIPYSSKVILCLPEDQRQGDNVLSRAHSIIFTLHHGGDPKHSLHDAMYWIAAQLDMPHLIPMQPEAPPPTTDD